MRNKSLFLLLACVCGTVAAIGVSQWMQANQGKETNMVEIFVTKQAIGAQEEITPEKIELEKWPADRVPQGSLTELGDLEGRYAKQWMSAGEPLIAAKLMDEKNDIIVPKGFSVVSTKADQNSGIANLVRQGQRVDVRGYFTKGDLIPDTKTMTILSGVKVFAIDGKTSYDEEAPRVRSARTISLLIRKADEEAWTIAQKNGDISLTLGNPSEYEQDLADGEASKPAESFLTWIADYQREKERLRQEALEAGVEVVVDVETGDIEMPAPKRDTFQMMKMHEGRMTVFEFTEGNPVPKIIADTAPGVAESEEDMKALLGDEPLPTDGDDEYSHLTGEDSPFYEGAER